LLSVSRQTNRQPEIFYSIQGEGISTGIPAMFLRLAFCNLRCSWCDTKYTWDWQHYNKQEEVMELSIREIEERLLVQDCRRLIVTGGEPLIQQKELTNLLASLKTKGFYIEIETNGTIVPNSSLTWLADQWNVSPKLKNSGNPLSLREIPEAYDLFISLPSSFFKYVIQTEHDLSEVQGLINKYSIDVEKIILMPEASDRETLIQRSRWLAEACKDKGYKFSNRLHVLLWGNKRGT
jgi:7-carboxy-7-deazaguanine synthase